MKATVRLLLLTVALALAGCAGGPPKNVDNACAIFKEKDDWYEYAMDSFKKWGVPVHVQLAIIWQESRFRAEAKAPKDYLLGFIPFGRKSDAYGYAQVKEATWGWYVNQTSRWSADRDDFEDAVDFIGWYGDYSHRTLGISKWDAYNQYLAYHEGHGGWKRKTYNQKAWLVGVAKKVKRKAETYAAQLKRCQGELDDGSWFW